MLEYHDSQEKRDHFLVVSTVVSSASVLLQGFRDWIDEESNALLRLTQQVEYAHDSVTQRMVEFERRRLRDIQEHDVTGAVASVREKIGEISDGAYSNIMDARRYLEEGLYRLETLARDLLAIRQRLEELSKPEDETLSPPGGDGLGPPS